MKYYSTNKKAPAVDLRTAVTTGLAPDNGLYMPEHISVMPDSFYRNIHGMKLTEIATEIATQFFKDDISGSELKALVEDALNFEIPLVNVHDDIHTLELFHGPTLAFKDVGARFMARLLGHFTKGSSRNINVLVATSGDTGSAVANGFYKVPGIKVFILYPKGLVSPIQEKQFVTLGENVTAIEVEGRFDDCQKLVKDAFLDKELNEALTLTSANSINLARLLPQSFYYFYGYSQLKASGKKVICSVPSGNFGNLCAGLIAKKMGLPIHTFLAATNANDIVPQYLSSGTYSPRPSVATLSNAMDVGNPSNFTRILDLYGGSIDAIRADIKGFHYTDEETKQTIRDVYKTHQYLLEPHGAIGYKALAEYMKGKTGCTGFFIETAHPAKFTESMEPIINGPVPMPDRLKKLLNGTKKSEPLKNDINALKALLLKHA